VGTLRSLPLLLTALAPVPGPATAQWNAWGDVVTGNGVLSLPTGAQASSYDVVFGSAPGTAFHPGWESWPVTTYVIAQSGVTTGPHNLMSLYRVAETGSAGLRGTTDVIETLQRAVEQRSWGRVKSLYR
jgi:hypothetical protein